MRIVIDRVNHCACLKNWNPMRLDIVVRRSVLPTVESQISKLNSVLPNRLCCCMGPMSTFNVLDSERARSNLNPKFESVEVVRAQHLRAARRGF